MGPEGNRREDTDGISGLGWAAAAAGTGHNVLRKGRGLTFINSALFSLLGSTQQGSASAREEPQEFVAMMTGSLEAFLG